MELEYIKQIRYHLEQAYRLKLAFTRESSWRQQRILLAQILAHDKVSLMLIRALSKTLGFWPNLLDILV